MNYKQIETSEVFSTDNLWLASVLKNKSFVFLGVNKNNSRRALFLFSKNQKLINTVEEFWNYTLKIEPRSFGLSVKELKNALYDRSYPAFQISG